MKSKHKVIKLQVAINAVSEQKVAEIENKNLDIVLDTFTYNITNLPNIHEAPVLPDPRHIK